MIKEADGPFFGHNTLPHLRVIKTVPKDHIPIVKKSRRYRDSDRKFIQKEISKLLKDGIIEHSDSLSQAQVLVIKDERHKKRMVVDYSISIV